MAIQKMTVTGHNDKRWALAFINSTGITIGENASAKAKVYQDLMGEVAKNYMSLYTTSQDHFKKYRDKYDDKTRNTQYKAFQVLDNYSRYAKKWAQQLSTYMNNDINDKKVRDLADKVDVILKVLQQDPGLSEALQKLGLL